MHIAFSSSLNKKIKKIPTKIVDKFFERLEIFKKDIFSPILNNHKLHAEYEGCSSINVTGNFRAIFKHVDDNHVVFSDLDTHPELYG
ncbi:MAG: hypothetical protein UT65_C0015G0015 [Parcubacteria group bacterium GW2011_GWF2_39_8b]|uniref:Addiction module toxin RelE n=3 Tax=Candidatus Zambryskiibacteriota TaxID=1817925 RepID=A0A1G2T5V5_9BACT|nr:MAG: hypothetical protein UT65_C0015G0015 [Parcubacteria group bacterium GW2011_GWF2_39_8b]KKR46220.1 MAG: hypothetical protein UT81_C0001G0067 [Parcubacteria group bacterium GW2011_GWA2_40_14]OHA92677.1 MAG: hypothetical protein A2W58_01365 [Candidatus Zambryskibacteria bacterium RIFCSPHIGHO2_02_38_10.5]OHA97276.1 MAG: hypothetical protein A3E32_02245 [Candidatus Zambryskibacteria bacterium RIFCSPHIGHO2_12_FULL_38_37]OHA97404.1 MAG: hypothetical protein A3C63_00075 [Candidatus Zambryskibact